MGLKVIGAGFGRTGTHSLATALNQLGLGPCYTFHDIRKNLDHTSLWNDALDGKEINWDDIYRGYQSAVEWPSVTFLPQLLIKYPDAKFILTMREPEAWFESASATIFEGLELSQYNPDKTKQATSVIKRRLILDTTFGGKYREKVHAIKMYEQHIQMVQELIPSGQLLQFHVKQGWAPLCEFLEVPVPAAPFPSGNDRASFLSQMPDWARKIKNQDDSILDE